MQVNILYRPSQSLAQCWLAPNESVLAESGAMVGMSTNVAMQTQAGGFLKGLKRMFGGESFFRNTFTAQGGQGEVLFAPSLCGDMTVLECGHRQYNISNSNFVACAAGVDVATKGSGKGFFSGTGLFVLSTQGQGPCIIGAFGALEEVRVEGSLVIDTGHVAAWDATLNYKVGKSGSGWIASWLSGEGLVCHFEGQGSVWVQTRNAAEYGGTIGPMLPPRKN